jgi:alanyl-tRNA synthetase
VEKRVRSLVDEMEALQRRLKRYEGRHAKDKVIDALSNAVDVKGVTFVASRVEADDVPALRKYGDELRNKLDLGLGLLCQVNPEKPVVLIVTSDRLMKERSITASDLVKRITEALPFRGGGKPHMAQVGIANENDFNRVQEFVKAVVESLL